MKKSSLVLVFLCLCVLVLYGCAGLSKKDVSPAANMDLLESQALLRFSDIPAPVGFKLLPQDSYTFESSGIRVGVLRYQGKADADKVVNFYKEQMSMYNWTLLNAMEYGDRLLNFEREDESCIVTILPKGKNATVIVSLGPRAQVKPRKSEKPVK